MNRFVSLFEQFGYAFLALAVAVLAVVHIVTGRIMFGIVLAVCAAGLAAAAIPAVRRDTTARLSMLAVQLVAAGTAAAIILT